MGLPLPDDARVTLTVGQLRAMLEGRDIATFDGVSTADAATITGENERTVRRLWARWSREQKDGQRPEVRVSRKGASDRSDMLFDRSDCHAYRHRRQGPPPEPGAAPARDADDVEGIVGDLMARRR